MAGDSNKRMAEVLAMVGVKQEDVEVMPDLDLLANGITDAEVTQIGKHGTDAMRARLTEAATLLNLQMLASGIDAPWRRLLDDFRDDIECTTRLQPLTLPDGTVQMACIDSGKFPGDPAVRDGLWKLHEILEEIDDHKAKHKAQSRKGGSKKKYDHAMIIGLIRTIAQEKPGSKLSEKEIRRELEERIAKVPESDTLYRLIKSARESTT